jgi:excisionase family DNA binding protein
MASSEIEQFLRRVSVEIRRVVREELAALGSPPPQQQHALTYAQAAKALGLSPRTIRRLVSMGQLLVTRTTSRTPRVLPSEIDRLRSPERPAPPPAPVAGRSRSAKTEAQQLREALRAQRRAAKSKAAP